MMIKNVCGVAIPFEVAVSHMDDTLREFIHDHIDNDCSEQEFFDLYCEEHFNRFEEEFFLNECNPVF